MGPCRIARNFFPVPDHYLACSDEAAGIPGSLPHRPGVIGGGLMILKVGSHTPCIVRHRFRDEATADGIVCHSTPGGLSI
ncbi:hypothetical protein L1S32_09160 [Methanogenium sp. S4BF]|uniref:hypothetical protein n=1 Tax=Methanogenium sp. S4BF TaxID=1789226 RepID=UPI002417A862|nr:hypothetical protein [Methanogenium sp. S4BF]WFN34009.1 hypothetical protein L1S32_09160 [Methanogenium sp. S4BF]